MQENNISDELSQIKFGDRSPSLNFVGNVEGLRNLIDTIKAICPDKRLKDLTQRDKEILMMMVRSIEPKND